MVVDSEVDVVEDAVVEDAEETVTTGLAEAVEEVAMVEVEEAMVVVVADMAVEATVLEDVAEEEVDTAADPPTVEVEEAMAGGRSACLSRQCPSMLMCRRSRSPKRHQNPQKMFLFLFTTFHARPVDTS